jgi:hypothetical protein
VQQLITKLLHYYPRVFPLGGSECQVGHAIQVLGLVLMQAGALPVGAVDAIVGIPICACCARGEQNERVAYELAFKAALLDYKARNSSTGDDDDASHRVAVRYRPLDWETYMRHRCAAHAPEFNAPATITYKEFTAQPIALRVGTSEGDDMQQISERSDAYRANANTMYVNN